MHFECKIVETKMFVKEKVSCVFSVVARDESVRRTKYRTLTLWFFHP
jgi:hypothetical protein